MQLTTARAGRACDPAAVFLTASTSEAFAYLLALLCDPGDAVLVPRPGYPLLDYLAALSGVRLVHYSLRYDGSWNLDLNELAERLGAESRVRAVFATSPGNPTGRVPEAGRAGGAGAALRGARTSRWSWTRCSPTTRCATTPSGPARRSARARCLAFVLSGLSKVALLPQLKLSWGVACGPTARVEAALARLALIADSFLSVATPVQLALGRIFAAAPELQARVRARTAGEPGGAARRARRAARRASCDVEGGWSAVLRLPALAGLDDEGWALALLESAGVLVQPGGALRPGRLSRRGVAALRAGAVRRRGSRRSRG